MLARASQRCDTFCERRLQAPGSTTLATTVSGGVSSINVASSLTLDNLSEQAVFLDYGNSNQEVVLVQPGGVNVTSWVAPYPATIALATPLQFGHTSGAPIQYALREVREAIKASMSDPYSEALQSQAAQLALAHLPPVHVGLTRISFLKCYPIQQVFTIEHSYSFDTTYFSIYDSSQITFDGQIIVEPVAGYVRYRVGTVITPEGMLRFTYIGGLQNVSDDIKDAVTYYLADEFQRLSNPYMATDMTQGKRRQAYAMKDGKSPAVQAAETILCRYRRMV